VQASKPNPECCLKALAAFENVQAQDCLVIEDSVAGITAAKRAGMKCLAVTTSYPPEKLTEADWVLPNLAQPLECCDLLQLCYATQ
jgi:beta-phosphoglucomutase-like phosphatase (HAD superfamily)